MYFSSQDVGQCAAMVQNWPHDDVEIIVVTDGSRILGLGDLGANGMGIPIGKLALYVAAGGINPRKVLPVMLDLGTDNKTLQQDPWYLGLPEPRLRGPAYYNMVDEFVHAVAGRWPHALIQFEDFSSDKAANILDLCACLAEGGCHAGSVRASLPRARPHLPPPPAPTQTATRTCASTTTSRARAQ